MTNKQMIFDLVELAVKNGFKGRGAFYTKELGWTEANTIKRIVSGFEYLLDGKDNSVSGLLFDHDFAKAVFGEEVLKVFVCPRCGYYKPFSKHDTQLFCPEDGRKLIEGNRVSEYDQPWKRALQELAITPETDRIRYAWENKLAE